MSAFAGAAGRQFPATEEALGHVLARPGLAEPRRWRAPGVLLVHRQRISTPEDRRERQPTARLDWVLAFDGRLDNRDDLARSLGMRVQGVPDSALILAALSRWGAQAPRHLIGPFAIAAWNRQKGSLLLARDAMGERALFVHQGAGRLAFATTPAALLALPEVSAELDEDCLRRFLTEKPAARGQTFFRDIAHVPAAECWQWEGQRLHRERFWAPPPKSRLRRAEVVEAAREALDTAVAASLRSDGPVVCTASAGLDSAGVAGTAARLLAPAPLAAVTVVPHPGQTWPQHRHRIYDERPAVEALAAMHPNLAAHFVPGPDPAVTPMTSEPRFAALFTPIRNVINWEWHAKANLAASAMGARVILQGGGGNFFLSRNSSRGGRLRRWTLTPPPDWDLVFWMVAQFGEANALMRGLWPAENRAPVLDLRLVNTCLAASERMYLNRGLARRALADRLPRAQARDRRLGIQCPEWFQYLIAWRDQFRCEIDRFADVPLARRMLDLPELRRLLDDWPADAEAAQRQVGAYLIGLPRAIEAGRFILWAENGMPGALPGAPQA